MWFVVMQVKWTQAFQERFNEDLKKKKKKRFSIWGSVNQKIKLTRTLPFPENFN